jgi:hypothetical protein
VRIRWFGGICWVRIVLVFLVIARWWQSNASITYIIGTMGSADGTSGVYRQALPCSHFSIPLASNVGAAVRSLLVLPLTQAISLVSSHFVPLKNTHAHTQPLLNGNTTRPKRYACPQRDTTNLTTNS